MVRGTAELIVAFENVGLYVRGAAFQDWVQDERLDRTRLSSDGERLVGSDATLLDHYLTTTVTIAGTPVHFRLGDQVINWSATSFLRDGLDLVNPLDLATGFQPASEAIDRRSPQGMLWAAASLSEIIAVEGYYQYKWKPLVLPPVGSYFSTIDIFGGGGLERGVPRRGPIFGSRHEPRSGVRAAGRHTGIRRRLRPYSRSRGGTAEGFRPVRHQPVRAVARRPRHADRAALHALSQPLAAALRNHRRCRRGCRHVRRAGRRAREHSRRTVSDDRTHAGAVVEFGAQYRRGSSRSVSTRTRPGCWNSIRKTSTQSARRSACR